MGELRIVKLKFRSALHLGADVAGIGLEDSLLIAHSDTLFSCLINCYAQLHSGNPSQVEKLLAPFHDGEPTFRISSAFPFQETSYYLPKPLIDPPNFFDEFEGREEKQKYGKLVRKTPLVSLDIFRDWLEGATGLYMDEKSLEMKKFSTREIRPQHARDRLTDAAAIYHTGLIHFLADAGLYFLIELNDETLFSEDALRATLRQAGINGLGGRRSLGNGVFKVTDDTIQRLDSSWTRLFDLPEQNGYVNLSLYLPKNLDNRDPVAYQLMPRRGWCYSSVSSKQMKRKTVTMFGEGSVFQNTPDGALADVTPDGFTAHKIYRYGIPISLPINILEKNDDIP